MKYFSKKLAPTILLLMLAALLAAYVLRVPSNDRGWATDNAVLPYAVFDGDVAEIRNIRNFTYQSEDDYRPHYYDKAFDMRRLESVDYIVEPFGSMGAAHTFLSFGFGDGSYVAISVEIRKEAGEEFSPIKGLFRSYELMYVIADENDVIKLRTNYRKNTVYLYPMLVPPASMRALFMSMLMRANTLRETPEFYNTLTNTCTTNIVGHVNAIAPAAVPRDLRLLLPEHSDELAYELGLIDQSITLEQARLRHRINERAERYADDPAFSTRIRQSY